MRLWCLVLAVWLAEAAAALAAPALNDPTLQVTPVVSGLSSPTTMAFIGPNDILVLQKNDGRVRRVTGGVLQVDEVLDVNVDRLSERGLLGIALHPDFFSTPPARFVYLYFTESSTGADSNGSAAANRVYRYTWDGDALTSPALILDLPVTTGPNHDGGIIAFGPDRKLYVVIGDLNRRGQLQNQPLGPAPDDTSVILRLNADGTTPGDNPFAVLGGAVARYYAYGIRNSFGMTFDPVTGALWTTENGPDTFDEINRVDPGFNSGWTRAMGPADDLTDLFPLAGSHYADPKFSWRDTVGPTGIVFLGTTALGAQYRNDAVVGDINNGRLYLFRVNAARNGFVFDSPALADRVADDTAELEELIFGTGFAGVADLKIGPDGRLYVVSLGGGAIYAISARGGGAPTIAAAPLPKGEVGVPYLGDLGITGGTPPYTVAVVSGTLPPGLAIVAGDVAGTPTVKTAATVTLRVTDQLGATASRQFKIQILEHVRIPSQRLAIGRVGQSYLSRLRAAAGQKPYAWSIVGGSLPAGLTLAPATGRVTGVPTSAGITVLTVRVVDRLGGQAQANLTLTVR